MHTVRNLKSDIEIEIKNDGVIVFFQTKQSTQSNSRMCFRVELSLKMLISKWRHLESNEASVVTISFLRRLCEFAIKHSNLLNWFLSYITASYQATPGNGSHTENIQRTMHPLLVSPFCSILRLIDMASTMYISRIYGWVKKKANKMRGERQNADASKNSTGSDTLLLVGKHASSKETMSLDYGNWYKYQRTRQLNDTSARKFKDFLHADLRCISIWFSCFFISLPYLSFVLLEYVSLLLQVVSVKDQTTLEEEKGYEGFINANMYQMLKDRPWLCSNW